VQEEIFRGGVYVQSRLQVQEYMYELSLYCGDVDRIRPPTSGIGEGANQPAGTPREALGIGSVLACCSFAISLFRPRARTRGCSVRFRFPEPSISIPFALCLADSRLIHSFLGKDSVA